MRVVNTLVAHRTKGPVPRSCSFLYDRFSKPRSGKTHSLTNWVFQVWPGYVLNILSLGIWVEPRLRQVNSSVSVQFLQPLTFQWCALIVASQTERIMRNTEDRQQTSKLKTYTEKKFRIWKRHWLRHSEISSVLNTRSWDPVPYAKLLSYPQNFPTMCNPD